MYQVTAFNGRDDDDDDGAELLPGGSCTVRVDVVFLIDRRRNVRIGFLCSVSLNAGAKCATAPRERIRFNELFRPLHFPTSF